MIAIPLLDVCRLLHPFPDTVPYCRLRELAMLFVVGRDYALIQGELLND